MQDLNDEVAAEIDHDSEPSSQLKNPKKTAAAGPQTTKMHTITELMGNSVNFQAILEKSLANGDVLIFQDKKQRVWSIAVEPKIKIDDLVSKAETLITEEAQAPQPEEEEVEQDDEYGEEEMEGDYEEGTEQSEDPKKKNVIVSVLNTEEC